MLRRFENQFGIGSGLVVAGQAVVFQNGQDFLFEINGVLRSILAMVSLPLNIGRRVVFRQQTEGQRNNPMIARTIKIFSTFVS